MPSEPDETTLRRSVVPEAAGQSPWLAAIWTGLGAAVVCATVAIVVVAICWLPVSGTTGRANSAIRAGLLSFLAAVHGGLTVGGVATSWLPLGMLVAVGAIAWRAGTGLADAADALGERDPARLALAGLAQAAAFALGCLIAVPLATLGTSRAPLFGVGLGALTVFALTGGVGFVRNCALRDWCAERCPDWLAPILRAGAAALAIYLAAGALCVAGSLVLHAADVEGLAAQVGGGWGAAPVLLLGLLAAPNAAIAGASYLAGPGFALGTGTAVRVFGAAHGTLPAFPVLGALPSGPASPLVWTVAALTAFGASVAVARLAMRAERWRQRWATAGGAALVAAVAALLLGWQAGGAAGDGRLGTVGPSPWRLGAAIGALLLVGSAGLLAGVAGWQALRGPADADDDVPLLPSRSWLAAASYADDDADDTEARADDADDDDDTEAGADEADDADEESAAATAAADDLTPDEDDASADADADTVVMPDPDGAEGGKLAG